MSQVRKLGEMYVRHRKLCPNVRPIFVSTYRADLNGPLSIAIAAGDDDDGARAYLPCLSSLWQNVVRVMAEKKVFVGSPQLRHGGFCATACFDTFQELRAQCYIHP